MGPSLPLKGCHRRGYPGLKQAGHKAATVARARYAGRSPRVLPHDCTAGLPAPHPLPTPTPPPARSEPSPNAAHHVCQDRLPAQPVLAGPAHLSHAAAVQQRPMPRNR